LVYNIKQFELHQGYCWIDRAGIGQTGSVFSEEISSRGLTEIGSVSTNFVYRAGSCGRP